MKKRIFAAGILAAGTLIAAQANASCQTFMASMSQRIQHNGVPANEFTLRSVPNDQAHNVRGEIIGNCNNASEQVVYTREGRSYPSRSANTSEGTHNSTDLNSNQPANPANNPAGSASSVTSTGTAGNN